MSLTENISLIVTAGSLGFFHTLLGPDHYVPFIAMSRAGGWSLWRLVRVTLLCGLAHVGSSVLLGLAGLALGVSVLRLEKIESVRGEIAGWMLLAFGLIYFLYGLKKSFSSQSHPHDCNHTPLTLSPKGRGKGEGIDVNPWILFTLFVFGPCEPLIPVLMYPAARGSAAGVLAVTLVFSLVTLTTMTILVLIGARSAAFVRPGIFERFGQAFAGFSMLMCGAAVCFLGA